MTPAVIRVLQKQAELEAVRTLYPCGRRKLFIFTVPFVANQGVPTSAALTLRKVESLLRHILLDIL